MDYLANVENSEIDVSEIRTVLVQGDSLHPVIRFVLVLDPSLSGLSWRVRGTYLETNIAVISPEIVAVESEASVILDWSVTADFTTYPGDMQLVLVGASDTGTTIVKALAEITIQKDWSIGTMPQITLNLFEQLMAQLASAAREQFFDPLMAELEATALKRDQTTPQTITGGVPLLAEDRVINEDHQIVDKKFVEDSMPDASAVAITDAGGHYNAETVEGALQEAGVGIAAAESSLISAPQLNGIANVVSKAVSGANIGVTFIGDSILAGVGATTVGTDDTASLVCSQIATKYGVTVTKSNRSSGGKTVAGIMINGNFDLALSDKADLYVIAFGKNDIYGDYVSNRSGYPIELSSAGLEHMIRRIKRQVPQASIILMTENPNSVGSTSSNPLLVAYNKRVRHIAAYYGCLLADGHKAFTDLGDYSALMYDASHPNSTGHALLAETIMNPFSLNAIANYNNKLPDKTLYGAEKYTSSGWNTLTLKNWVALTDNFNYSGFTGSDGNYTATVAGSYITCKYIGAEAMLLLDCGAGNGVVSIVADGVTVHSSLDLGVMAAGDSAKGIIVPLGIGVHFINITVISGTVVFRGYNYLDAPVDRIDNTSEKLTYTGAWTQVASTYFDYGGTAHYASNATDLAEFDFIGTGFGLEFDRTSTTQIRSFSVDGVSLGAIDTKGDVTMRASSLVIASGLEYGHHHVTMTCSSSATGIGRKLGAFFTFDETQIERSRIQRGIAIVGDVVVFPVAYGTPPIIRIAGDNIYATGVTANGFTTSGTEGAMGQWESEGGLVAF